ncbi:hypothetical protein HPB47_003981 [Ixodes persulcatus]|uniref:Uncharacterized protein n=1 Tax=Ixodes persulcatus TaxID=34615 RepID=A0AC60PI32_IXOPE|nr:hypothetical protein HPB47_003981 [Ixodes persulcatus]
MCCRALAAAFEAHETIEAGKPAQEARPVSALTSREGRCPEAPCFCNQRPQRPSGGPHTVKTPSRPDRERSDDRSMQRPPTEPSRRYTSLAGVRRPRVPPPDRFMLPGGDRLRSTFPPTAPYSFQ